MTSLPGLACRRSYNEPKLQTHSTREKERAVDEEGTVGSKENRLIVHRRMVDMRNTHLFKYPLLLVRPMLTMTTRSSEKGTDNRMYKDKDKDKEKEKDKDKDKDKE